MLRVDDLCRLIACARWLLAFYAPEQRALKLRNPSPQYAEDYRPDDKQRTTVAWLLARRTCLVKVVVEDQVPTQAWIQALAEGGNPLLREVSISFDRRTTGLVKLLGDALAARATSGQCAQLTTLALRGHLQGGGGQAVLLSGGLNLQRLRLEGADSLWGPELAGYLSTSHVAALQSLEVISNLEAPLTGEAVLPLFQRGPPPPDLHTLELDGVRLGQEALGCLAAAIRRGAWPKLRTLTLRNAGLWAGEVGALMRAMAEGGARPALKTLDLAGNQFNDAGMQAIARVALSGACPNLETLDVALCGLTPQGVRVLSEALIRGAVFSEGCPQLKHLSLGYQALRREGMAFLAEALVAGAGARLVELRLPGVSIDDQGLEPLLEVVHRGVCPRLGLVDIRYNSEVSQGARDRLNGLDGQMAWRSSR